MKQGRKIWSLGILSALLLFSIPSSTLADYVCWPFGSTPLSGFPSCTNNKLDVNATVSGGATPIPFPTFPWPVTLPTSYQTAFPTPNPIQTQPFKVVPATTVTPGAQVTMAASNTSVVLFAGNSALNGFTICNSSASDTWFNFGPTATAGPPFWQHFPAVTVSATTVETCFTVYGVGVYRGPISAISTTATGTYVFTWW